MKTNNDLLFVDNATGQMFIISNKDENIGFPVNAKMKSLQADFFRLQFVDGKALRALTEEEILKLEKLQAIPSQSILEELKNDHIYFNLQTNTFFVLNKNSYKAIYQMDKTVVLGWNVDKLGDPVEEIETTVSKKDLRPISKEEKLELFALNAYHSSKVNGNADDVSTSLEFSFVKSK